MKFLEWYVKIGAVSALIGASMEMFMIKTGFCSHIETDSTAHTVSQKNDNVTVLESEKLAWENSPEAKALREALNPWRNRDAAAEVKKDA